MEIKKIQELAPTEKDREEIFDDMMDCAIKLMEFSQEMKWSESKFVNVMTTVFAAFYKSKNIDEEDLRGIFFCIKRNSELL